MDELHVDAGGAVLAVRASDDVDGRPALMLSGGPGCVNYLPAWPDGVGVAAFAPDPRGVGASTGGPHEVRTAISDLEAIRDELTINAWSVVGHSFGADLGLAYVLAHPDRVQALVSVCGTGVQNDRDWHATYHERSRDEDSGVSAPCDDAVHASLLRSWRAWIKRAHLLQQLATR